MLKYLTENLRYPAEARLKHISGDCVVRFVVTYEGKIDKAKILRSLGGGCDEEALRLIKEMPAWTPGMQDGIKVNVRYTLPIRFKLEK